jgi:hypothetical protein
VILALLLAAAGGEECCDEPGADCCEAAPIPPPSVVPPLGVPEPAPGEVVLRPGVIVHPPPELEIAKRKPDHDRMMFKLSVGGAYQNMLEESVGGAAIDLMLGAEDLKWGGGGKAGVVVGQTRGGLTFTWFRIGGGLDFHAGPRARITMGFQAGVLAVKRAAGDRWMVSPSLGLHLGVEVDLVRDRRAPFFAARVGGDVLPGVTNLSLGALLLTAGLGYRL